MAHLMDVVVANVGSEAEELQIKPQNYVPLCKIFFNIIAKPIACVCGYL